MRLVTNDPLIKRNATLGKYAAGAGLVVLLAGLLVSFYGRDNAALQMVPFVTLIVGFVLSNIGIYFTNHYRREPRADQALEAALKGFDDKYHLYNFYLPAPHFLVAPSGLFVLIPKFQSGEVQWDGKRWKHKKANFLLSLLGQEGLANPTAEAAAEVDGIAKYLTKKVGGDLPPVQAIIVFYNPNVTIEGETPPVPAVHVKQLKDFLRRSTRSAAAPAGGGAGGGGRRSQTLTSEQLARLDQAIGL
jgi:hypothetical protein